MTQYFKVYSSSPLGISLCRYKKDILYIWIIDHWAITSAIFCFKVMTDDGYYKEELSKEEMHAMMIMKELVT